MFKAMKLARYTNGLTDYFKVTSDLVNDTYPHIQREIWKDAYVLGFFGALGSDHILRMTASTGAALSPDDIGYIQHKSYAQASGCMSPAQVSARMAQLNAARVDQPEADQLQNGFAEGRAFSRFMSSRDIRQLGDLRERVDAEFHRVLDASRQAAKVKNIPVDDDVIYRSCILPVTLHRRIAHQFGARRA